jgi:hypothetical protein
MVKRELGLDTMVSESSDDAQLSQMITEYSAAVSRYCRRVFLKESVTQEYWPDGYQPCLTKPDQALILPRRPIDVIESLTIDGQPIDLVTSVRMSIRNGLVYKRNGDDACAWYVCRHAIVKYSGGFDFDELPPDLQRATMAWVKEGYINRAENTRLKSEQNYNVGTWQYFDRSASFMGMPEETIGLLNTYREPVDYA